MIIKSTKATGSSLGLMSFACNFFCDLYSIMGDLQMFHDAQHCFSQQTDGNLSHNDNIIKEQQHHYMGMHHYSTVGDIQKVCEENSPKCLLFFFLFVTCTH